MRVDSTMKTLMTTIVAVLILSPASHAVITGIAMGTVAPPATLGPHSMTPFPDDARPVVDVTTVASPSGGDVAFSIAMSHRKVGVTWLSWSHGYTGDVYFSKRERSVTLTMPAGTIAFYLYAEPTMLDFYDITATVQDGTSVIQSVDGLGGACGYGFYGTDGSEITTIQLDCAGPDGFAIGEFGIATVIPEPPPTAEIDIKPGSYPNSINLGSKGVVPVAVLTTDDFDASTIDPGTVQFAGASPVRSTLEDVDGDGDRDMLFHFGTQELDLDQDSTEATLTAKTKAGHSVQGTDSVRIVPRKPKS